MLITQIRNKILNDLIRIYRDNNKDTGTRRPSQPTPPKTADESDEVGVQIGEDSMNLTPLLSQLGTC